MTAGDSVTVKKRSALMRFLDGVERVGNKLPHPATLFAIFALTVAVASWLISRAGITAVHPGTGETINVVNMISSDGLRFAWTKATDNFVYFPPLGIVLVAMIGIGVAEGSGLISALLRHLVTSAPPGMVTAAVIASGILSHLASSAGYVVLIPLGAMIFAAFGRHPIAGLAAAFLGVSGGFGANFLIGSIDPILAGLTDARGLFEQGTMEERKRVIRAFIERLTVDGLSGHAELEIKRIPDAISIRDSFKVVAGIRCEVGQRDSLGEVEVIPLSFSGQGASFVLAGVGLV